MRASEELIEKIENITLTDYEFKDGETENWRDIVEDLIIEYEHLLEEYNNYRTYVEDNYSIRRNFNL